MKKRKIIPLAVLLVLLAALVGAYAALSSYNKEQASEAENDDSETFAVCRLDESSVTALSYNNESAELSLVNSDGTWQLTDDEAYPVDEALISKMLSALCNVEAHRTVDGADDTACGLDEPSLTVTVDDGEKEHVFKLGDTNSYNSLRYLDYNGTVYMISDTLSSAFEVTKEELFAVDDTFPSEITEDSVISVVITDSDGRENTVSDSEGLADIIHSLQKYCSFATPKGYGLDESGLAEYGITEDCAHITVNYEHSSDSSSIKASFELLFGKSSTGDAFYALPSGDVTYSIDSVGFDELMAYVYHTPSEEETTDTETDAELSYDETDDTEA